MTRRIATRVLVGVAIGLILMGARALGAHAATLELSYNEFTSPVTITATTEATATTVVTANAYTYDGATPVLLSFFAPLARGNASGMLQFVVYDNGATTGIVAQVDSDSGSNGGAVSLSRRVLPSAGSHTYSMRALVGSSTGTVYAGAGSGAGLFMPGFLRVSRANPSLDGVGAAACGGLGNPCMVDAAGTMADQLDLGWWGTWAVVGLLLVLMIAPTLLSALRVTRGM